MKYPKLNSWIEFSTNKEGNYIAVDKSDFPYETYVLSNDEYVLLSHMDGKTDPASVQTSLALSETDELIDTFIADELLRTKRYYSDDGLSWIFPLVNLSHMKVSKKTRYVCFFCSLLLAVICLPILFVGIINLKKNWGEICWDGYNIGIYGGLFLALILHEFSHAVAEWGRPGGKVYEAGILLFPLFGAYIRPRIEDEKQSVYFPLQLSAAGVEMNLFLAGVAFLLEPFGGGIALGFGFLNIVLALSNIALLPGLDGFKMYVILTGKDDCRRKRKLERNMEKVSNYIVLGQTILIVLSFVATLGSVFFA